MWRLRETNAGWTLWRNGAHYCGPYDSPWDAIEHTAYLTPLLVGAHTYGEHN